MRILIINPNSTEKLTRDCKKVAKKYAAPDTEITSLTIKRSPKVIETVYDEAIASFHMLEALAKRKDNFDAFIIVCGVGPGVAAARELTGKLVVTTGEAAILTAGLVADKFSILVPHVPGGTEVGWRVARALQMEQKCASVRVVGEEALEGFFMEKDKMAELLCPIGRRAKEDDGARALVLLSAGMIGVKENLEEKLKIPVLDGLVSALKTVEQFPYNTQNGITPK